MSWFTALSGRDRNTRNMQQMQQRAMDAGAGATADPYSREGLVGQENTLMGQEQGYGSTASADYLKRAQSFDPQSAVNTYAQGAWGSISAGLKDQLKTLQGQAVGAGRLNTGFYDQDNGTVINRATDQLSNAIAQQSMGAEGLALRNQEDIGQFGQNATSNYADLLTGRRQEVEQDYRDAEDAKKRRKSGIGAALGGLAGFVFSGGNPAGAAVGSSVGGAVFS